MNVLHLLWIIPASASIGYIWGAMLAVGKRSDQNEITYEENNTVDRGRGKNITKEKNK